MHIFIVTIDAYYLTDIKVFVILNTREICNMERPYSENDFAEFWIEDNILFFIYKKNSRIDIAAAQRIVEDRIKLQQGVAYSVFCDAREVKDSDKAGRDYLANEGSHLVKVVAVITGSPITKMMSNFYLAINKPLIPTKLFTDKSEAIAYLKSFTF
jgi:hypothetical protein